MATWGRGGDNKSLCILQQCPLTLCWPKYKRPILLKCIDIQCGTPNSTIDCVIKYNKILKRY